MQNYQEAKTKALEAFSKHAKPGQKIYIEAARFGQQGFEAIVTERKCQQVIKSASCDLNDCTVEDMQIMLEHIADNPEPSLYMSMLARS
jgi:hypothetical protein